MDQKGRAAVSVCLLGLVCGSARSQTKDVTTRPVGPSTLENLLDPAPIRGQLLPRSPTARAPVPDEAAIGTATEVIREAFAEDYASVSKWPKATCRKFMDVAENTLDPVRRLALLREAERIARESHNTRDAMAAATQRVASFELEPFVELIEAVAKCAEHKASAADSYAFSLAIASDSMKADHFVESDAAIDLALRCARLVDKDEREKASEIRRKSRGTARLPLAKSPQMLADAIDLQRAMRIRESAFVDYERSKTVLLVNPRDPKANGCVGRYLCFHREQWGEGLPFLAASDEPTIRAICEQEIAAIEKPSPGAVMDIAGRWWTLAADEKLPNGEQFAILAHAKQLYKNLLPLLTDPVDRALAERRGDSSE